MQRTNNRTVHEVNTVKHSGTQYITLLKVAKMIIMINLFKQKIYVKKFVKYVKIRCTTNPIGS